MRAPKFWQKPRRQAGIFPLILSPLAALWQAGTRRRLKNGAREKLPKTVICIGNINVGGTGKTPAAIALQGALAARGQAAHIISRGYGGSEIGPVFVQEQKHSASQIGDEPLLMAAFGPVWVAKDRAAGAKAAIKAGADIILLDDGFQNPSLHHDLAIVVIDAAIGFGNGRIMPAGPLREKVSDGLARADMIISIGDAAAQQKLGHDWPEISAIPRLTASLKPLHTGMDWRGLRVIAFAGIGRPGKFFKTLREQGAHIIAAHGFADHCAYPDAVLKRLKAEAAKNGAQLVTTEKDAVRLPVDFRRDVLVLPVRLSFDDPAAFNTLLDQA